MENEKIKGRLDPADRPRRQAISALSFYGFYITEYCNVDRSIDELPQPGLDISDWYFYLALLLSDMGIIWLRETMSDWGCPMPDEIYDNIRKELSESTNRTPAHYPEAFAGFESAKEKPWSSGQWSFRTGVIALEYLRKYYPKYYETVVKLLCGLLLHYAKYWGIPHYNSRYAHREGLCEQLFTTEDLEVADWNQSPGAEGGYQYAGFRKGDYIKCAGCGEFLHVDNDFVELSRGKGRYLVGGVIPNGEQDA